MTLRIVLSVCLLLTLVSCGAPSKDEAQEAIDANLVDEPLLLSLSRASSPSEALRLLPVSIGDKVRIVPSPISDELGISGMTGEVIWTSNSATGAIVYFKELEQEFGLSSNQLELTDLPPGTDISMGDRKWVSNQDGEWIEIESGR